MIGESEKREEQRKVDETQRRMRQLPTGPADPPTPAWTSSKLLHTRTSGSFSETASWHYLKRNKKIKSWVNKKLDGEDSESKEIKTGLVPR